MKNITLTLLLLTISLINFSQVKTSNPIGLKGTYYHIKHSPERSRSLFLGEYKNSFLYFSPNKEGGKLYKFDSDLNTIKSTKVYLETKKKKSWFKYCRLQNNEIQFFTSNKNEKLNEKSLIVYTYNATNLEFITKKTIHKFTYPKIKYRSPISTYTIVESPDKSIFTILLQSPVIENHVKGTFYKKRTTLTNINCNETFDLTTKKQYIISKNTNKNSFCWLTKKELTNTGKIILTYSNSFKTQELFVVDIENSDFIKTKELLKIEETIEDQEINYKFSQIYNDDIDETFLFGYKIDSNNQNINFQLIGRQAIIKNKQLKLPGRDNETIKKYGFIDIHSVLPIEDGFIIISEYAIQNKSIEMDQFGRIGEFKGKYSFYGSNTHLIVTKLNFDGKIIWDEVIENIRTYSSNPFENSSISNENSIFLLYKGSNYADTKLTKINIKKGYSETKLIQTGTYKSPSTKPNIRYHNPKSNNLYFLQTKGDKVTIKSVSLNNF